MSKFRDKVDHFLFHFSYSVKIKSVIFIALGTAIFVAIMLIASQHHLYTRTQRQIEGVRLLNAVNELYEASLLYNIAYELGPNLPKGSNLSPSILKQKMDDANTRLKQATQAITAGGQSKTADSNDLWEKLMAIENMLGYVERGATENILQQEVQNIKLQEQIRQFIRVVASHQDLDVSIDATTFRLLSAISHILPDVQMDIATLMVFPELFKPTEEIPLNLLAQLILIGDRLEVDSRNVLEQLQLAQQQNSAVSEKLEDAFVQNVLAKYSSSLNLLLSMTPPSGTPSSTELLVSAGVSALTSSFKMSHDISTITEVLLARQSRTLKWREYFGAGFISFGCIVGLAAYTTRLIRRPLYVIRQAAEELAKGNLSSRIHITEKDEVNQISEAFNQMVDQIETIIRQAGGISTNLASSASNIFKAAKQLETNVVRQERAITQIASNAKGVSRTVQDFAKSLQEVSQTATLTTQIAETSRTSLNDMEAIMHQMAKASMNIVKTLSDLQGKIGAINKVISAIVRIADQINLLSLNTAIRSGKKGTHHLGFSVVAEKINELANQTALATLDIEELVQKIIEMVSDSVKIVDNFSDQIRNQVFEAAEIGEQLKRMISQSQEQFEAFETVNQGMQEQARRASQIHEAISALTNAAQKTTQSVRNLYLEIEYLHHSTGNLLERTNKLTNVEHRESLGRVVN